MILCVDVDYRTDYAVAAGIAFKNWGDEDVIQEIVEKIEEVKPYESGHFFRRELPCIIKVLSAVKGSTDAIVIDGYVWLDDYSRAGLGAHLYESLNEKVPVIGVAKTRFFAGERVVEITRGQSVRPLFVTSVGISLSKAALLVKSLGGRNRIPTLLKRSMPYVERPDTL